MKTLLAAVRSGVWRAGSGLSTSGFDGFSFRLFFEANA